MPVCHSNMLGEQLYPYSFHGSSFPRIVMLPNVCPAPGRMQREPVRWRERRPMCFLQSFRRMSRADLRAFFCRMFAEVGLAPEARYREQPGGVRRVDQVALRRLALDLQDCPFFFFFAPDSTDMWRISEVFLLLVLDIWQRVLQMSTLFSR